MLAAVLGVALSGCSARQVIRAAHQRSVALRAESPPPATTVAFQVGLAVRPAALEGMIAERLAAEGRLAMPDGLVLGALPGLGSMVVDPDWDALVVELRPGEDPGGAEAAVLVGLPGEVEMEAGPVAMRQPLRLTLRVAVELGAEVGAEGGLTLWGRVVHPEVARLAVSLPGTPPGMDAAVSVALEAELRRALARMPPDPRTVLELSGLGGVDLPIGTARVELFPGGRPLLCVGLQTTLPVRGAPATVPAELDPGEDAWIARIDAEPLAVLLSRAGLTGGLGPAAGLGADPVEVRALTLEEDGFAADLRIYRSTRPVGVHDLRVGGDLAWRGDHLEIGVHTLRGRGAGSAVRRSLPWSIDLPVPALPVGVRDVATVSGAVVARGSLEPGEP